MRYLVFIVIFLLSACSGTQLNSNIGSYAKNKIEHGIRKAAVKRYTNYQVWELNASQLGYVETDFCQLDFRDSVPGKNFLIDELEVKAQKLGGNGLVFDSCIVHKATADCYTYTKCRGMAYLVRH
ncbi:hypothetical protein SG34_016705 [Thalassomonas viridans]|uniref:Lipoprotein n=1 Tax=Thalassomonas viridans TaxID=137584 RepID=A0AAE9YXJ8_9GAMM|nr:hypothetical protein [Thalassomonas viridans]WDE03066.1 hypothetical protein SG34_016705 [Thalassomonas viridans]